MMQAWTAEKNPAVFFSGKLLFLPFTPAVSYIYAKSKQVISERLFIKISTLFVEGTINNVTHSQRFLFCLYWNFGFKTYTILYLTMMGHNNHQGRQLIIAKIYGKSHTIVLLLTKKAKHTMKNEIGHC